MPSSKRRAPAAVSKYLLPREQEIAVVRNHPGSLLVPAADAVGAVVIALALTGVLAHSLSLKLVIWVPTGLLVAQLIWAALGSSVGYLAITNERVLQTSGLLRRKVTMIPIGQLVNMNFERTLPGRVLGYGSFVDGSGGGHRVLCEHVPYPEQLYLLICEQLYPGSADDGEDDGLHMHAGDVLGEY